MSTYLDSSVFVRRYAGERVGAARPPAPSDVSSPVTCRITQVEVLRVIGRADSTVELAFGDAIFTKEMDACQVVELDEQLAQRAARIAIEHGVRSLDAIHLAAAELMECTAFATGDRRQGRAARELGFSVVDC